MKRRAAMFLAACALAACSNAAAPTGSGGPLATETTPTTLLPVLVESTPVQDTETLAPDTMFAGDLCTALVAGDFTTVTIGGVGTGRLTDAQPLADDICAYSVRVSGNDVTILVRARTAADFGRPATTDETREALSGIGTSAVGVAHTDTYEVFVQVANGYFSVTTPDKDSARTLARAAAKRALAR